MKFSEVVTQAIELLHQRGRITYRALKREFDLDDEALDDLIAELIDAQRVAADEDGKVLVWAGASPVQGSTFQVHSFPQPPIPNPQSLAERRQLTVMFCDLVGSTALSAQLDPEDYHRVVQQYHQTCDEVIQRYAGFVPQHLGWALTGGGVVLDCRCEPTRLLARVEEAERLGRAQNLPFISEVLAQLMKGVAWLRAGRFAESIPQLQGAIEIWNADGGELWLPYWRAALAEGLAFGGDLSGRLQLIEGSLTQIMRPGWEERWYLAEVLRLKGWILSLQGDLNSAEQNYLTSLDWARQQQAKSWELRAATSLARLWQQQGKKTEAHQLLANVYNWFTEGFDTKDLQEAKALLEELSHEHE